MSMSNEDNHETIVISSDHSNASSDEVCDDRSSPVVLAIIPSEKRAFTPTKKWSCPVSDTYPMSDTYPLFSRVTLFLTISTIQQSCSFLQSNSIQSSNSTYVHPVTVTGNANVISALPNQTLIFQSRITKCHICCSVITTT